MTPPLVTPGAIDAGNPDDAADELSKLVAGNQNLITHPHLVTALMTASATPQQAQAINLFVGGLQAQGRVTAAMQTGAKINLSTDEKAALDSLGVDYTGVQYTPAQLKQVTAKADAAKVAAEKAAQKKALADAQAANQDQEDGTDPATQAKAEDYFEHGVGPKGVSASGVIAGGVNVGIGNDLGQAFHTVTHNPATNALGKIYNFSDDVVASAFDPKTYSNHNGAADERAMRAAGYDPDSTLSVLAYMASGKDKLDPGDLYKDNDPATVDEAIKFSDDPKKYLDAIVGDQSLTPDQIAGKLKAVQGKPFQNLVTRVQARQATVGNMVTQFIDPVKHPDIHRDISAGVDIAYSFVADPTLAIFAGAKAIKATQIALDTVDDAEKVRNVLSGVQRGAYAQQVRNGVTSLLDNTRAIREAKAAFDEPGMAAAYARIRTETPGLEHLASDFLGGARAVAFQEVEKGGPLRYIKGDPITNMSEAADYLSSSVGLVRLRAGRAMAESNLMPGQLSTFGFKKLRGSLAAGAADRGVRRDSRLLFNLNKPGEAGRVLPTSEDAVNTSTGHVLENHGNGTATLTDSAGTHTGRLVDNGDGTGTLHTDNGEVAVNIGDHGDLTEQADGALASQQRAAQAGDNLLAGRTGFGPSAVAARARLLAQRLFSFLPRSTSFATDDPNAVRRVFDYGRMYLTNGHANLIAAAYAAGDEGARKAILKGLQIQTLHAAGLGTSEAGRAMIDSATRSLEDTRYASQVGSDLDKIIDPNTGQEMRVALWDTQVNPKITLPGFADIQKNAAKIGIWENTVGRVFKNQLADNLMGIIKPGWLITGTNVVRNSGEDLFGTAVRGEFGDVARARAMAENNGLLPKRTKLGNAVFAPFGRVAQLYRHAKINTANEDLGLQYIADLDPQVAAQLSDNWQRLHAGSMIDPAGVEEADAITKLGYMPRKLRFERTGFAPVDTGKQLGAERLSNAIARVVDGNPDHAQVVLNHLADPEGTPVDAIVASLKHPGNAKRVSQMTRANVYRDSEGVTHRATTDEEKEIGLQQLAEDQVADLHYLVSNPGGDLNQKLVQHLRDFRKSPSTDWLMTHLPDDARPSTVMAPQYEAVPLADGVTGLAGAIADIAGKGYQHLVERPIMRVSSMPIFLSNYGKSRFALRNIEKSMIDGGLSAEAADKAAQNLAMDMAFTRTVKYIDDPGLRTQMDIVGRNFFAFSRATQAFVRRWGTQFIEDPARLRRAMLTMEGAQHSGLVYTDENGQKQFIFPGSGMAINAIQHLESLIPGVDVMKVPGMTPDLTGQVALLQPGLQNPLQMSLTPMVNIPMRAVFDLFPQHRQELDKIDSFLNGSQGRGQSLLSEVMPTTIKKFTDALNSDDRDSMTASATRQALLNLAAAGKLPSEGADPAAIDTFLQNLKQQTSNQLILRAIFGYFTPSPPGTPTEATSGSKSDWYYGAMGVHGLDSEYKTILNEAGGDPARAGAIWTALHPDKSIYTVGTTQLSTKSATLNATKASQKWIEGHLDFMDKYKGISAYFIPKAAQKGDFDLGAYNAELELGLRQHKSTSDFYKDVRIKGAQDTYYAALTARDAAIAKAGDDTDGAKTIQARFDYWYKGFKSLNPLFAAQQSDYSQQAITALGQLRTLRRLVQDKPNVPGVSTARLMVDAYDTYHAAIAQHPSETNVDIAIKKSLAYQYNTWMQATVKEEPQFAGLYQGVFRVLDTHALDKLEDTGA